MQTEPAELLPLYNCCTPRQKPFYAAPAAIAGHPGMDRGDLAAAGAAALIRASALPRARLGVGDRLRYPSGAEPAHPEKGARTGW